MIIKRIRLIVITLFAVNITGCTTLTSHQQACEQRYSHFIPMARCLKKEVNEDKLLTASHYDLVQYYITYADVLANQVEKGSITESEARYKLAQMLISINSEVNTRNAKTNAALNSSIQSMTIYNAATYQPVQPTYRSMICHQAGAFISCN